MSATIGKISQSLKSLLEAQMAPSTKVTLLSPGDSSSAQLRVNLFLYRVIPNSHLNNRDWLPKPGTLDQLVFPPLTLNLFYLLTPFAPVDPETGIMVTHELMGEAMRVLYENAIVPQAFLDAGLQQGQVKVTLHALDLEELSKIWLSLSQEFRLSAVYEVSYVDVPAKREQPLPKRVLTPSATVNAVTGFPTITSMSPLSGPVGTAVQFRGQNLAGWKVTVRVGRKLAAQDAPVFKEDTFAVTIPAGLVPGIYAVDADLAGLTRFQSYFEVTP